jgi:hypothetical protein
MNDFERWLRDLDNGLVFPVTLALVAWLVIAPTITSQLIGLIIGMMILCFFFGRPFV